jgi:hypothetical protein
MQISSRSFLSALFSCGVAAFVAGGSMLPVEAAPAIPDPCKLITASELEQIAGPMKGAPKPGGPGEVACEYTPAKALAWIRVSLADGELNYWKSRNGGKNPVSLPELGSGAFVNPDFEGSADLYAKKGSFILRITLPKGPTAVDTAKAIAKKVLPRL